MARIDYPDLDSADDDVRAVAQQVRDARGGRLLNLYRMQLHNPAITAGWLALGTAVRYKSELDPKLRELAICYVARLTGAEYEWQAHRKLALGEGFDGQALDGILDWRSSKAFDERQRAVLGVAEASTRNVEVDDATFNSVKAHLPARHIVELVATIGYYNMVARFLVGLGVDLE
jgi:alkylhydroperoxidase family enzyme